MCNATGFPKPDVIIVKDGEAIAPGSYETSNGSLLNGLLYQSVSLLLSGLTFSDTGLYSCNASNELASLQIENSSPTNYIVQCKYFIMIIKSKKYLV